MIDHNQYTLTLDDAIDAARKERDQLAASAKALLDNRIESKINETRYRLSADIRADLLAALQPTLTFDSAGEVVHVEITYRVGSREFRWRMELGPSSVYQERDWFVTESPWIRFDLENEVCVTGRELRRWLLLQLADAQDEAKRLEEWANDAS